LGRQIPTSWRRTITRLEAPDLALCCSQTLEASRSKCNSERASRFSQLNQQTSSAVASHNSSPPFALCAAQSELTWGAGRDDDGQPERALFSVVAFFAILPAQQFHRAALIHGREDKQMIIRSVRVLLGSLVTLLILM